MCPGVSMQRIEISPTWRILFWETSIGVAISVFVGDGVSVVRTNADRGLEAIGYDVESFESDPSGCG